MPFSSFTLASPMDYILPILGVQQACSDLFVQGVQILLDAAKPSRPPTEKENAWLLLGIIFAFSLFLVMILIGEVSLCDKGQEYETRLKKSKDPKECESLIKHPFIYFGRSKDCSFPNLRFVILELHAFH